MMWLIASGAGEMLLGYALRLYGEMFAAERCDYLNVNRWRCTLRQEHHGPHRIKDNLGLSDWEKG